VIGATGPCDTGSVSGLSGCDPVIADSTTVTDNEGTRLVCTDPIGGGPVGGFGEQCRNNGTCDGDLSCNEGTCQEFCFSDLDCDTCAATNAACTCNTDANVCEAGGGGDFGCATAGSITGTSATETGSTTSSGNNFTACAGDGNDDVWRFSPTTGGTYRIEVSGYDTVLSLWDSCSDESFFACDDDGSPLGNGASRLDVPLDAGVTILIVVDSFGSSGNYTLTINRL
jgi:hypothetical protein